MCFLAKIIVYYLNVSFSRLITSVGKRELVFLLSFTRDFVVSVRRSFLFQCVLVKAAVFSCGTPCAFHITIQFK